MELIPDCLLNIIFEYLEPEIEFVEFTEKNPVTDIKPIKPELYEKLPLIIKNSIFAWCWKLVGENTVLICNPDYLGDIIESVDDLDLKKYTGDNCFRILELYFDPKEISAVHVVTFDGIQKIIHYDGGCDYDWIEYYEETLIFTD